MSERRTGYNNLTVEVFSAGTTRLKDPAEDLSPTTVKINSFSTQYPGGLYANADLFVPRDVVRSWLLNGGQRLVIRNGLTLVWEGLIDALPVVVERDEQGMAVNGTGLWGALLGRRTIHKAWSDQRLTDAVWPVDTTAPAAELCSVDRYNRIRFTPKANEAWPASAYAAVTYTAPTCQMIKYIGFNFKLQEQAQDWELRLRDTTAGVTLASIITSGSGACAITPASPRQSFQFQFLANAACTPLVSGSYYGQVTSLDVRCASGAIVSASVVKDVAAWCSDLNSDRTQVGTNDFALTPFVTERPESLANVLQRIAAYGDSSYNAWAAWLNSSETAATPDGKPVIVFEQQPALTDYDYAIRLDEENLQPPINIVRDFGDIVNWVTVRYRDELSNRDVILTPDDDANLKDTTSITTYGQRELPSPLDAGQANATTAKNIARRYLAAWKDPKYYISGPITVAGYIRDKSGQPVPASQIRAGKRIKIENYLQDLSGTGLTALITGTMYNDAAETCSISTGVPDNLAVFNAQRALLDDRVLS